MASQEIMPLREELVGTAITAAGSTEGSPTRIPAYRYYSPEFAQAEHEKHLSSEEVRIINMHRNLERYLDISPSEMSGGPPARSKRA